MARRGVAARVQDARWLVWLQALWRLPRMLCESWARPELLVQAEAGGGMKPKSPDNGGGGRRSVKNRRQEAPW